MRIIAGKFRGQLIAAPKGSSTRPTASRLRETLFNVIQAETEGCRFLDIFAGSGAIGIEALSRGAAHATFIDNHKEALRALDANLSRLQLKNAATVLYGDYLKILARLELEGQSFDIAYADAPYGLIAKTNASVSQQLIDWFSIHNLLKPKGRLFIEDIFEEAPISSTPAFTLLNTRRSGKAYLHQFQRLQ